MFDLNVADFRREMYLVDGRLVDEGGLPHPLRNRGFQYADGFFETIRVAHGIPQHLHLHVGRIMASSKAYGFTVPTSWNATWFRTRLLELCQANRIDQGGRIRLTFFRAGGGRYTPESDGVTWVAEAEALATNAFELNEKGHRVDIFPEMKKPLDHVANFKNLSCGLYVQSGLWARERSFEESLITNTRNHVIESTRSNLFLVSNGVLYTPGLDSGTTGGIMRAAVANLASGNGYKVYECDLTPQELLRADELFLTNAIRGIQWVSSYRTKRYFHTTADALLALLNDSLERPS